MKKFLLHFLVYSLFVSSPLFADGYAIMVDAGSTGSRLHVFQYNEEIESKPFIQDILSVKDKDQPGLSDFVDKPEAAGPSLKKGLEEAVKKLKEKNINPSTVKINILATAGMRMLPEDQQEKIYVSVTGYLKKNYPFIIGYIGTISGKNEALYGWIDVNYLQNHFDGNMPTIGSIDMGGASTQLAFETKDMSKPNDIAVFKLGKKTYTIFAKSFLGLGLEQARAQITPSPLATTCYPTGYKPSGAFDSIACSSLFNEMIKKYDVAGSILSIDSHSKIVAYSGAYHTYNFLEATDVPTQATLEKRIQKVCTLSWEEMKKRYPQEPEKYVSAYCANAVYLDNLFYNTYHVDKGFFVASKINNKEIDWSLGAMLFGLTNGFNS